MLVNLPHVSQIVYSLDEGDDGIFSLQSTIFVSFLRRILESKSHKISTVKRNYGEHLVSL